MTVSPIKWRRKPAGIDMKRNYVTVILCIFYAPVSRAKKQKNVELCIRLVNAVFTHTLSLHGVISTHPRARKAQINFIFGKPEAPLLLWPTSTDTKAGDTEAVSDSLGGASSSPTHCKADVTPATLLHDFVVRLCRNVRLCSSSSSSSVRQRLNSRGSGHLLFDS